MNTAGKYYIWMNAASTLSLFWSQETQSWTTDAYAASFFDTREAAEEESVRAQAQTSAEALVLQATRDLP